MKEYLDNANSEFIRLGESILEEIQKILKKQMDWIPKILLIKISLLEGKIKDLEEKIELMKKL